MYLARDLGKKSRKEIGPRRSQNLIHVFGKRSWKEISERNWTKKEESRRNQNLIHVFVISSKTEILERVGSLP